eukprot:9656953-Alexandrium_andersonii.AAC.1
MEYSVWTHRGSANALGGRSLGHTQAPPSRHQRTAEMPSPATGRFRRFRALAGKIGNAEKSPSSLRAEGEVTV